VILEFVAYLLQGRFVTIGKSSEFGWDLTSVEEMVGCLSFRNHAMAAIHRGIHKIGEDIITYVLDKCQSYSSLYILVIHLILANYTDKTRLDISSEDLVKATSRHPTALARLLRDLQLPENL
jgi:hypothetical protein